MTAPPDPELSVVMPCLNEADTVVTCVTKALKAMAGSGVAGEVIVADNGSTDGSQELAARAGARVVAVAEKGYGSALMGGIAAARGRYVLMGDADDSYDFLELPKFVAKLREGYDLVQGCRLPAGGGTVNPGAMPWSHRWIGNPMFSFFARRWFKAPIHDIYCGMRAFSMALYQRLNQRCTGMEFATEMIIKSSLYHEKITEVPITLHKDGRIAHPPHLKTVRDGWRTLRFFLLYSPRWLFLFPGLSLVLLGLAGTALALPGVTFRGITFDVHTLLYSCFTILLGVQGITFAVFTKVFAVNEGLVPPHAGLARFFRWMTLERGVVIGLAAFGAGLALLAYWFNYWAGTGFGALEYPYTLRRVIPGALLTALGLQAVLASFFTGILGMKRK